MGKKFEEDAIAFEIKSQSFIYFLLKESEVVYVGQTTSGLTRPYKHRNKKYDQVKVIFCEPGELDSMEDKYIKKYNPIYNKQPNFSMNYSIPRIKSELLWVIGRKLNLRDINRAFKDLEIEPYICYDLPYISPSDFEKVRDYFVEEVKDGRR